MLSAEPYKHGFKADLRWVASQFRRSPRPQGGSAQFSKIYQRNIPENTNFEKLTFLFLQSCLLQTILFVPSSWPWLEVPRQDFTLSTGIWGRECRRSLTPGDSTAPPWILTAPMPWEWSRKCTDGTSPRNRRTPTSRWSPWPSRTLRTARSP